MQTASKNLVAPQALFRPIFVSQRSSNQDQKENDDKNGSNNKDSDQNGEQDRKDKNKSKVRGKEKDREREKDKKERKEKTRENDRKDKTRENDDFKRSRSRSKDKEKDRYVTSNTRATIPIKLKGEDKELQSIKIQYLGLNKEKKKVLKPSEKFKNIFNFEWDPTEDTSHDANPLYSHRHEENLLFGRGLKAGIDIREQKKNSCNYEGLVKRFDDGSAKDNKEKVSEREKEREKDKEREKLKEKDREREREKEEKEKKEKKKKEKTREKNDDKVDVKKKKENFEKEEEKMEIEVDESEDKRMVQFKFRDLGHSKHWSEKTSESMNERDWRIFREDNDIIIKGGRVPKPMRNWDEAVLPTKIAESVRRIGYTVPTPIQMQAIPIGMECKDLIGIAPTGSGKSAAFLIPLIAYLQKLRPLDDETCKDGPYSLILTPTRELALQIDAEFQKFALNTKLRSAIVVGGRKTEDQAFTLRKGCEVLIGTPGRIKDALQSKYTVLNQCNWVILDEADKMIDLGFEEDVNFILDSIPQTNLKSEDETTAEFQARIASTGEKIFRVTHLFSATMPAAVERMAKKYLRSFCYISIGEPGGGKKEIEQKVEMITENQKKHRLQNLLDSADPPIIIFVNQKKGVEVISNIIEKWGWKCVTYHGGKTQEQREAAVDGFKNKKYDILIATDLASRGLDVEGVKMVVNFDAPKNIQDFIHRTGRTGRAGKKGLAVTYLTSNSEDLFYDLKEFLIKNNQEVPQELAMHPASKVKPGSIPDNVPRRKQILYIQ